MSSVWISDIQSGLKYMYRWWRVWISDQLGFQTFTLYILKFQNCISMYNISERAVITEVGLSMRQKGNLLGQRNGGHGPAPGPARIQRPLHPPRHLCLSGADKRSLHAVHYPGAVVHPSNRCYRLLHCPRLALFRRKQDAVFVARLPARLPAQLRALRPTHAAQADQSRSSASDTWSGAVHQRALSCCRKWVTWKDKHWNMQSGFQT